MLAAIMECLTGKKHLRIVKLFMISRICEKMSFATNKFSFMKNRKSIYSYLVLPAFLFCNSVTAQMQVYEEPHHKVVFENEYVRLLEGHIQVHDTTLVHIHPANS